MLLGWTNKLSFVDLLFCITETQFSTILAMLGNWKLTIEYVQFFGGWGEKVRLTPTCDKHFWDRNTLLFANYSLT